MLTINVNEGRLPPYSNQIDKFFITVSYNVCQSGQGKIPKLYFFTND